MRTLLAVALINVQGKLHIQAKVPRNARFKGLFFGFSSETKIKTVIILSVIECLYTCHYYMLFMYTLSLQQTDEIDASNIIPIFHMRKLRPSRIFFFFKCQCQSLGHVQLFVTLWTIAHLASHPWNSPGKNTGVGCHFILQGIFLTQGLNLGLLNCRQILYQMSHQGSPGEALKSHTIDEIRISFI